VGIENARFYPGVGPYHGKTVHYAGYEPSKEGMARCALGPEIHRALKSIVDEAIVYAELTAPNDTSEYQSAFFAEVIEVPDIPYRVLGEPMARWSGRVGNSSPHAIVVEVGGHHTPEHRVLRHTLEWIELVTRD
jgi:hypothetical protein